MDDKQVLIKGKDIFLSCEGSAKVRQVEVEFLNEECPIGWMDFQNGYYEEDNWLSLDNIKVVHMTSELTHAIINEQVIRCWLSLEQGGEGYALNCDFESGWAAVCYDDQDTQIFYNFYNAQYADSEEEAPVNIGGQTPVLMKNACSNMKLVAEIVVHFLETGQLYPDILWDCTLYGIE